MIIFEFLPFSREFQRFFLGLGFEWYTKEALENLFEIWVENIIGLVNGRPQNKVN